MQLPIILISPMAKNLLRDPLGRRGTSPRPVILSRSPVTPDSSAGDTAVNHTVCPQESPPPGRQRLTFHLLAVRGGDVSVLAQRVELHLEKVATRLMFQKHRGGNQHPTFTTSGPPHLLILVRICTNRGQREAVRLIQPARRRGRDAREGFGAVRGQVEGRSPGGAVVQRALYDEVAGTRTLSRLQSELQQRLKRASNKTKTLTSTLKWSARL